MRQRDAINVVVVISTKEEDSNDGVYFDDLAVATGQRTSRRPSVHVPMGGFCGFEVNLELKRRRTRTVRRGQRRSWAGTKWS